MLRDEGRSELLDNEQGNSSYRKGITLVSRRKKLESHEA